MEKIRFQLCIFYSVDFFLNIFIKISMASYWVTQKLPQICTVICVSVLGRLRDLQYIFAVTSGSHSITFLRLCVVPTG